MRIAIADDHELLRAGIRRLLEMQKDIEIVGEAGTGRETIELCRKVKPDILLLDFSFPDMDGLDITQQIAASNPDIKILVLTMHDNEEYAIRLFQAGASGFLIKGSSPDELYLAIKKVAAGKTYLTPELMEKMDFRRPQTQKEKPASLLSDRELQVLIRLASGKIPREIADELNLSLSTVETYRRRILEKLSLRNVSDLTRFAIQEGLIEKF